MIRSAPILYQCVVAGILQNACGAQDQRARTDRNSPKGSFVNLAQPVEDLIVDHFVRSRCALPVPPQCRARVSPTQCASLQETIRCPGHNWPHFFAGEPYFGVGHARQNLPRTDSVQRSRARIEQNRNL